MFLARLLKWVAVSFSKVGEGTKLSCFNSETCWNIPSCHKQPSGAWSIKFSLSRPLPHLLGAGTDSAFILRRPFGDAHLWPWPRSLMCVSVCGERSAWLRLSGSRALESHAFSRRKVCDYLLPRRKLSIFFFFLWLVVSVNGCHRWQLFSPKWCDSNWCGGPSVVSGDCQWGGPCPGGMGGHQEGHQDRRWCLCWSQWLDFLTGHLPT